MAFVGGINLTAQALGSPGHREGHRHDVYVELSGSATTDVHHNFVQRWNEASGRAFDDGRWGHGPDDRFFFRLGPLIRAVRVWRRFNGRFMRTVTRTAAQALAVFPTISRMVSEQSSSNTCWPSTRPERRIYIENQAIPVPPIAAAVEEALKRGVDVVVLVPAEPEEDVRAARRDPERSALFDQVARLGRYEHFALVGIAALNTQGGRSNVYVHAKIMLIDDAWATIGSCNLHSNSLYGHTEMNASFWDAEVVRALRCALLTEHLGEDTAPFDMRSGLRRYRDIAWQNRYRHDAGDPNCQGLASRLDPATYGE